MIAAAAAGAPYLRPLQVPKPKESVIETQLAQSHNQHHHHHHQIASTSEPQTHFSFKIAVLGDQAVDKRSLLEAETRTAEGGTSSRSFASSTTTMSPRAGASGSVFSASSAATTVRIYNKVYSVDSFDHSVSYVEVPGDGRHFRQAERLCAGVAAVVVVFSMHDRSTLSLALQWAESAARASKGDHQPRILLGCHTRSRRPEVSPEEAAATAASAHMTFYEASAMDGSGVSDAFRGLVRTVASLIPLSPLEPSLLIGSNIKLEARLLEDAAFQRAMYI